MSEKTVNSQNICGICNEKPSKYCCPRCEVFYCSLNCYKSEKHLECSENFYRECVKEELASNQVDDESKRKMMEILKKMHKEDAEHDLEEFIDQLLHGDEPEEQGNEEHASIDSDDCEGTDLHERVKDLNLDDPDVVWDVLTQDEKNEFQALVSSPEYVDAFIRDWEPWWLYKREEKLVEEVGDNYNKQEEINALKRCPSIIVAPSFSSLTTVKPSPRIIYNITNVIAAYAFATRYFYGRIDPIEGSACIIAISDNLNSNANFLDFTSSIESAAQNCLQSYLSLRYTSILTDMKNDTTLILHGPSKDNERYYCKSLLSDLIKLFSDATMTKGNTANKKHTSAFFKLFPEQDQSTESLPEFDDKKVKKCIKKIEYYLSYIDTIDWQKIIN